MQKLPSVTEEGMKRGASKKISVSGKCYRPIIGSQKYGICEHRGMYMTCMVSILGAIPYPGQSSVPGGGPCEPSNRRGRSVNAPAQPATRDGCRRG